MVVWTTRGNICDRLIDCIVRGNDRLVMASEIIEKDRYSTQCIINNPLNYMGEPMCSKLLRKMAAKQGEPLAM